MRVCCDCASYDNYMLINSYLTFSFCFFAFFYDNLIAIRCTHKHSLLAISLGNGGGQRKTITNLVLDRFFLDQDIFLVVFQKVFLAVYRPS